MKQIILLFTNPFKKEQRPWYASQIILQDQNNPDTKPLQN